MNARSSIIQSSSSTTAEAEVDAEQEKLLKLARSQGMNTDARRLVFITLLTATDYKQAAENLLLLKLTPVQRREVIRVLVHCLGSEGVYNPYYVLIGQEICRNDHGMRITLQYCLWDFLREIGQTEVGGQKFSATLFNEDDSEGKNVDPRRIANMARAFGWWVTHDCLSLQALKTVDFTVVKKRPAEFLGLLFVHLVLSISAKSPAKTLSAKAMGREEKLVKFFKANLTGGSVDLSKGLLFFLNTKLDARAQKYLVLGEEMDKEARKRLQPLLEKVKEGLEVVKGTIQGIVQLHEGVGAGPEDGEDLTMDEDSEDDVGDKY